MTIEQITTLSDLKKMEPLIRGYPFKPYYFLRQLKEKDINALFVHRLAEAVSDKSNFFLAAKEKENYLGFAWAERMPWDSSFFGFACYRLEHLFVVGEEKRGCVIKRNLLESIFSLCKEKNIRYLHAKADAQDQTSPWAYASFGFNLVSVMLPVIYYTQDKRPHLKQLGVVRPCQDRDLDVLRKIAKNSMRFDHFHSDPHFSKKVSDSVYEALIENCCKGELADKVFVVERKGKVVGYVACQIRHDLKKILPIRLGHIRHLAVAQPDGFGCGPGLQEMALSWFQDKVDVVESATTVQNTGILKISLKSGMNIAAPFLRFAKWFEA